MTPPSSIDRRARIRWRIAVSLWLAWICALIAASIGALDLAVGVTETGNHLLRLGVAGLLLLGLAVQLIRPKREGELKRLFILLVGLWSFAAFAIFLVWRIGSASEQREACEEGDAIACGVLGERKMRRGKTEEARPLFEKGCELSDAVSCRRLGGLLSDESRYSDAQAAYRNACAQDDAVSCLELGKLEKAHESPDQAMVSFGLACDLGLPSACAELSLLRSNETL